MGGRFRIGRRCDALYGSRGYGAERPVSISLYHREASGGENGRAPVLDHGAVYLPGRGRIAGLRRRLLLRTKAEEIKI